jgi:hypothetical protein
MSYKQLDSNWQKISAGGHTLSMQNRTTEQYEILVSRDEPSATDKGFIVYEQKISKFTNLPIWARSPEGASLALDETIYPTSELNNAIHSGIGYAVSEIGTVVKSTNIYFLARVGEKQIHFDNFDLQLSAGNVTLELYKNPTITAVGTPVTPDNLNDPASIPCETLVYTDSTISNDGTRKHISKAFSSGSAEKLSTSAAIAYGRVLDANTDYIVKITNLDENADVEFSAVFTFHECEVVLS